MKKYTYIVLLGAAFATYAPALLAAPFCVTKQGLPLDCNYYDAVQCRNRAQQLSAVCTVNEAEITLQPGIGKYCVVNSSRVSMCSYTDRTTCDSDAMRSGGVCVDFPGKKVQPNPYDIDPNSKY